MKLPKSNIHTESEGDLGSYQFSLEEADQGLVFEMLRKKIYSDPIGTIIREIASNARDANRENNKESTPIEISIQKNNKLINNGESKIAIKDSGPGISPERMETIFVKYGKSTKRNTNEFTGGFGIGGKTPFSYKDVFTIETTFEGTAYTYIAYIDESKRGKIQLQSYLKTKEPSGTSIIIPVNENDVNSFKQKALYFTSLWKPTPIYKGFGDHLNRTVNTLYEDSEIVIISEEGGSYYNNQYQYLNVLIDGIPYPIKTNDKIKFSGYGSGGSIFLKFNNAEVDVSTNRENLHYNDLTINKVNEKYEYMKKLFIDILENDIIKTSDSYLEACSKYEELRKNRYSKNNIAYNWLHNYNLMGELKYDGIAVKDNFTIKTREFVLPVYNSSEEKYKYIRYSRKPVPASVLFDYQIYTIEGKMNKFRTDHIINNIEVADSFLLLRKFDVWKFKDVHQWERRNYDDILKEDNELLKSLNIETKSYDEVVIPKKKRAAMKKDFVEVRYRKAHRKGANNGNTKSETFKLYRKQGKTDTSEKFIYVKVNSLTTFSVDNNDFFKFKIFNYYNNNEYSLMVINSKTEKDLIQLTGFISIEKVKDRIKDKLNGLAKLKAMLDLYNDSRSYESNKLLKFGKAYLNKNYDKSIKRISKLKVMKYPLYSLISEVRIDLDEFKIKKDLIKTRNTYIDIGIKYPLLSYVNKWRFKDEIKDINLYIQSCDKNKN